MAEFVVGANLPWLDYGLDFGANAWQPDGGIARPERQARLRPALRALAHSGASLVRWWVLGDGRAGLRQDRAGYPLGLDGHVFRDLDCALDALRETRLRALLVLTDFLWFARARVVNGVCLGGRRDLAREPVLRHALVEQVFEPLFERYGGEPAIAGWDLMNEPEWATLGLGTVDPRSSVTRRQMRTFLRAVIQAARRHVRQPLTVGLASVRGLGLVCDLDLDYEQVHWYDGVDSPQTLARPVASLGRSREVLLGEYPTRGSALRPDEILETARRSGYAGALAWSALAEDRASDGAACVRTLAHWTRQGATVPRSA